MLKLLPQQIASMQHQHAGTPAYGHTLAVHPSYAALPTQPLYCTTKPPGPLHPC
jgi:hypothetical protein